MPKRNPAHLCREIPGLDGLNNGLDFIFPGRGDLPLLQVAVQVILPGGSLAVGDNDQCCHQGSQDDQGDP